MADTRTSKPFGPVAAAFIAAGIGAVTLGILTTLAEASSGIKDTLQLSDKVGPLSGKTIGAVAVFFLVWAVLGAMWKTKDPSPSKVFIWTWVMLAVAILLTFPIFFQMFAS